MDPRFEQIIETLELARKYIDEFSAHRPDHFAALIEIGDKLEAAKGADLLTLEFEDYQFELLPRIKDLKRRRNAASRAKKKNPTEENKRILWQLIRQVKESVAEFHEENAKFNASVHEHYQAKKKGSY